MCNSTPLLVASKNGHTEIVQLLLAQPRIEINCEDISPFSSFMSF